MLYLLIKWLHIFAAITAVGSNITYGIWTARATRDPAVLPFTLRTIKFLDDRVANPAYAVLLVTGFAMTGLSHLPIAMPWIAAALSLYALMGLVAVFGYSPTLKRQIAALDRGGVTSPEYVAAANRARLWGIILGVIVAVIVFLMVVKPQLW